MGRVRRSRDVLGLFPDDHRITLTGLFGIPMFPRGLCSCRRDASSPVTRRTLVQSRSFCRDPDALQMDMERERQRAIAEAVVRQMNAHELVAIASGRLGRRSLLTGGLGGLRGGDAEEARGVSQVRRSTSFHPPHSVSSPVLSFRLPVRFVREHGEKVP